MWLLKVKSAKFTYSMINEDKNRISGSHILLI